VSHTDGVWSYRTDRAKLIVEMTQRRGRRKGFALYDLADDPGEQHDLVRERGPEAARLHSDLRRRLAALGVPLPAKGRGLPRCELCSWQSRDLFWQAALEDSAVEGATTPGEVDEETLQRLRDLGYTD
jgi:arylsulfatase A-like enzyme